MPTLDDVHALVIGIANYRHINRLPATVLKDAHDIRDLLIANDVCGYPADNVQLLCDDQASVTGMRAALSALAQRTDGNSTVFLYISSHGGQIESGPDVGEYILPADAQLDLSISPPQLIRETAISGDEFSDALDKIPARKAIVILDCCHAGGIGQIKHGLQPAFKVGLPESYYDRLKAGRGRVLLASSRSSEFSHILPGAENSLFTKHLLAGLRGGIPSEDGLIRVFDLFEYIQPRVSGEHPNQHPIFKAEVEENFPVALYLGGQKGTIPTLEGGFRYDAYISYVDKEPDSSWVWDTLVPRLEDAGLRMAVSGDAEEPGVARVVNVERGIRQAKRTIVVLSDRYLADHWGDFESVLGQTMGIQEGTYRVLPIKIEEIDTDRLPTRLSMLSDLDLSQPRRSERDFGRLVRSLQGPLPRRWKE